jgi:hypothetical protein
MGRGAAAMQTLLNGTQTMAAGEGELSRVIVEFGPVVGIGFWLFRFSLAAYLIGKAIMCARDHDPLALLLLPIALIMLFQGVLEQTTEDGFLVMGLAFSLAAIRLSRLESLPVWQPVLRSPSRPRTRLSSS